MATAASAHPMNGGNGPLSYSTNSTYQRGPAEAIEKLVNTAITNNFDNILNCGTSLFRITDMGCSVGPNTFHSIQTIIQAIINNPTPCSYSSSNIKFQVFLNDHVSNDFNTLFHESLSHHHHSYYLAGVPGSFHNRLFPTSSLHLVHTSYALQWLSKVPEIDSNQGKVCYSGGGDDTVAAYRDQFLKDFGRFLNAREREVVPGGLVLVVIPGRSDGTLHRQVTSNITYSVLGDCLIDMVHKGMISGEKVDTFNIPIYFAGPNELKAAVEANGGFTLEMMECIRQGRGPGTPESKANSISSHLRAGMEVLLDLHFGNNDDDDPSWTFPMDELFDSFKTKLLTSGFFEQGESGFAFTLFAALKRKSV